MVWIHPTIMREADNPRIWLRCELDVLIALSVILTCDSYQNQREVGAGIKRALREVPGLKREDLFIVSFWSPLTSSLTQRADIQAVEQVR